MRRFLSEILYRKRARVEALKSRESRKGVSKRLAAVSPPRDFVGALRSKGALKIIAEMKQSSPSRGMLAASYSPEQLAEKYQEGGAAALSVLTEEHFFGGNLEHLERARRAVQLPVLRKDFILDPVQLEESRGVGSDAVLLIVRLLTSSQLVTLIRECDSLGMSALVEVHDSSELGRALDAGATLVGVNNRDLDTLEVDLGLSLRLSSEFPPGVTRISESGIRCRNDLERLSQVGYQAFLVGQELMVNQDPVSLLKRWTN